MALASAWKVRALTLALVLSAALTLLTAPNNRITMNK